MISASNLMTSSVRVCCLYTRPRRVGERHLAAGGRRGDVDLGRRPRWHQHAESDPRASRGERGASAETEVPAGWARRELGKARHTLDPDGAHTEPLQYRMPD